jgi:rhamnosyl/mannosyltransferase
MNVLHVYQSFPSEFVGGLEESIRQICAATAPTGVANSVYYLSREPEQFRGRPIGSAYTVLAEQRAGVLWSCALPTFDAFKKLSHHMRRADLIHFHLPWPICDVAGVALNRRTPAIATYHADIQRQRAALPIYRYLLDAFLGRVDRIVATSPEYASSSPVLRRHSQKVSVIPLCLQDDPDAPSPNRAAGGRKYVLFVGALRYYKGLDTLLDASKHVDFQVKIVGDGELRAHIERRCAEENLKNVELLGTVSESEKRQLIAGCSALVLPSDSRAEAFGVVLLEAMRAAKPTITTDLDSGMRYVQGYGSGGILIPPHDVDALASAMKSIVSDDPAHGEALGRVGRDRFLEHFTPQPVGAAYAALYKRVLAGARGQ